MHSADPVTCATLDDFGKWLPDHIYEVLTFGVGAVVLVVAVATLVVAWKTLRSADAGARLTERTIELSEEAGKLAKRSVELAEETASQRPVLEVGFEGPKPPLVLPRVMTDEDREEAREKERRSRPPGIASIDPLSSLNEKSDPHGYVNVSVRNSGKVVATGVHGWLELSGMLAVEKRGFRNTAVTPRSGWLIDREGMDPLRDQVQCYADEVLPHGGNVTFSIQVAALVEGQGGFSYRFVCKEGCETEGIVPLSIVVGEADGH